eukprot:TRINITY_DN17785_c0_g1_i1.p1 TRINITY_DN17785_c0_g1~~TRINITY_DN17785_c0_g1_i1.p1  ORF type:complete len:588 (+),score=97.49 TRINITY_DN17785_c0_g1_i1:51-1766(+)
MHVGQYPLGPAPPRYYGPPPVPTAPPAVGGYAGAPYDFLRPRGYAPPPPLPAPAVGPPPPHYHPGHPHLPPAPLPHVQPQCVVPVAMPPRPQPPLLATIGPPAVPQADTAKPRDFAEEKPEVYRAFERMAVQSTENGVQVSLPDQMCLDRHVPDFLLCLGCWLRRSLGDPATTGRPWRLRCLDLSRNSLSNSCLMSVVETLQRLDVRVGQLWLAGNRLEAKGLAAMTEYVWNCQDAIRELDIADNEVVADPTMPNSDTVSALLRCFYNHASYPRAKAATSAGGKTKAVPLLLKLAGNHILHPKRLLKEIQAKVGKKHLRICQDTDPFSPDGDEFLAVCVPDITKQRRPEDAFVQLVQPVQPVQPVQTAAVVASRQASEDKPGSASASRSRSRGRRRRRKQRKHSKRSLSGRGTERKSRSSNGAALDEATKAANDKPLDPAWPLPPLDEAAQAAWQKLVHERLGAISDMPPEASTRNMLAEYVVCMLVARKGKEEIQKELHTFIEDEAASLVEWIGNQLQAHYGEPGSAASNGIRTTIAGHRGVSASAHGSAAGSVASGGKLRLKSADDAFQ